MSAYVILHHGIKGQKWGVQNGPPYPIENSSSNKSRRKAIRAANKATRIEKRIMKREMFYSEEGKKALNNAIKTSMMASAALSLPSGGIVTAGAIVGAGLGSGVARLYRSGTKSVAKSMNKIGNAKVKDLLESIDKTEYSLNSEKKESELYGRKFTRNKYRITDNK